MGRSARRLLTDRTVRAGFVLFSALSAAGLTPAAAGVAPGPLGSGIPPRLLVTDSGPEAIVVAVSGLQPVWRELPSGDGSPSRWLLAVDGFISGGAPGTPRVPSSGGWLVVPPGTRPRLQIVAEIWQPAGLRPLAIETMPVQVPGLGDEPASLVEMTILPGQPLPAGALPVPGLGGGFAGQAGPAVAVGEPVWWRGRRIAPCRVVPVRYDAQGVASETLVSGQWEVRFVPDKAAAALPPAPNAEMADGTADARFAAAFLNGELLSTLPTEARAGTVREAPESLTLPPATRAGKAGTLLGAETRLAVSRTGPTRVTYSRLRERGLIPNVPIAENQVRLYQRRYLDRLDTGAGAPYVEIEVPIRMVGDGGAFAGNDFFVFQGLRLRDDGSFPADLGAGLETVPGCGDAWEMNNEANLYWLACAEPPAGQAWARMATARLTPSVGAPLGSFRHQAHLEESSAFRENLPSTTTDRMYVNLFMDTEVSLAVTPFWRPDPAGAEVDLRVAVAGFNNLPRPLRFELVTDTANVTLLEDYTLTTAQQAVRSYTLPVSAINGATTKVRISRGVLTTPYLFAFLNWFEIGYDALFNATGNELRFHGGEATGARPIEVTGFTSADIGLLEITDPRAPVFVTMQTGNVVSDGATWKLSVMPDQAGTPRVFHALGNFGTNGVAEFNYLKSSVSVDATDPTALSGGTPDLIVVTHPTFRAALERWVQHRIARSGGKLKVHVVETDDIYDWYSGGLRDPWAIKRFCNHALTAWESWALVIVGDANENALGKRVLSQASSWATDWVPTHYHTQQAQSYEPELMASDKWYTSLQFGANYPVEDFPGYTAAPRDMLAGRLPCNSVGELDLMIDKIIGVETPQASPAGDWRRRGFFIADDEWSNGYGADALTTLQYNESETDFLRSEQDSLAAQWASATGVTLEAALVSLKEMLDPRFPYTLPDVIGRDLSTVRQYTATGPTRDLLAQLSRGGLFASYQGHANHYVLSSEFWLQDRTSVNGYRVDTALLTNTGRPWFFIGLGCHIADWAQNPVYTDQIPQERGIGEKLLLRPAAGASAVYASSGYEFITANRVFGETISRRWTRRPPATRTVGPGASAPGRSRWVLGELLWAAEADLAAVRGLQYPFNEMLAQYVLLGDPLLTLDAGEPVVEATLHGEGDPIVSDTVELVALDATNLRTLSISAHDEAGIDRLEVVDDRGNDLTSQVAVETLPDGAQTHQRVDYELTVPVQPYDHTLTVRVFDTGAALPTDRHWELALDMPVTAVFVVDGQELDPRTFAFEAGVPVAFSGTVASAAWITPEMALTLTSETLLLSGVQFNLSKGRGLTVDFTATAEAEGSATGHRVVLGITVPGVDRYETEIVLQNAPDAGEVVGIGRVLNFPNPMGEDTRFVIETNMTGSGRINLWSVAGSPVAHIAFIADGQPVSWDGRDARGDKLANGTYLYRVEIEATVGTVRSEMQRLVIMR